MNLHLRIVLFICPRQKRDKNMYLSLKCLKRDVFYVNENIQRYNKKILYYNIIEGLYEFDTTS